MKTELSDMPPVIKLITDHELYKIKKINWRFAINLILHVINAILDSFI